MTDFLAWLWAQVDSDERLARRGLERQKRLDHPGDAPWERARLTAETVAPTFTLDAAVVEFSNPGRVLAEVESARRLLTAYRDAEDRRRYYERDGEEPFASEARGYAEALLFAIRCRALVYRGRPGYRQEWAP